MCTRLSKLHDAWYENCVKILKSKMARQEQWYNKAQVDKVKKDTFSTIVRGWFDWKL